MARMRERSGGRSGAGTGGHDGEGEGPKVPLSDPQEFVFLPPRLGNPMTAALVQNEMNDYRTASAIAEGNAAVERWLLARRVRRLYDGFAERVRGYPTFTAFAVAELGISRRRVSEALRISEVPNEELARRYGISKMLVGALLLELTGLQSWKALEKRPFEVKVADPVFFPQATVEQLELAARVLQKAAADGEAGEGSETAREEARRRNEELEPLLAKKPALRGAVEFVATAGADEPALKVRKALGREGRKALLEVLRKIVRDDDLE